MNLNLKCGRFSDNIVSRTEYDWYGEKGVQYIFRFENGYGASVIKHKGCYSYYKDLWELAALLFEIDDDYVFTCSTPITADYEGFLSDENVMDLLQQIEGL